MRVLGCILQRSRPGAAGGLSFSRRGGLEILGAGRNVWGIAEISKNALKRGRFGYLVTGLNQRILSSGLFTHGVNLGVTKENTYRKGGTLFRLTTCARFSPFRIAYVRGRPVAADAPKRIGRRPFAPYPVKMRFAGPPPTTGRASRGYLVRIRTQIKTARGNPRCTGDGAHPDTLILRMLNTATAPEA